MVKGIQEDLCHEIAYKYMTTDYTATRMLGYLYGHAEASEQMIMNKKVLGKIYG